MKPIRLEFRGLNSYIEKQEIDFCKLTENGLFGIFGPTGSGKSTILDALTLALYGYIPRGCKEFVNTNCEDMLVIYTFELNNRVKGTKYIAERCFKKKNGTINTKYVRLLEISPDGDRVIAEKTKEMNDAIIGLIGLTAEDFTRSVVIPQGKFSEFLKLKGAERRYMLERIFDLEQYGKRMTDKIRKQKHQSHDAISRIDGGLAKYEGLSLEQYTFLIEQYNIAVDELKKLENKKKEYQREYDRLKRILELNNDLKQYQNEQETLQKRSLEIEDKKNYLEKAKRANVIKPELEEEVALNNKFIEIKDALSKSERNLNDLVNSGVQVKDEFIKAEIRKEKELPQLKYKLNEIARAIELNKNASDIKVKIDHLKDKLVSCNSKKHEVAEQLEKNNGLLKASDERIEIFRQRLNALVDKAEYKDDIERAAEIEREYKIYKQENEKTESDILLLEQDIIRMQTSVGELNEQESDSREKINELNNLIAEQKEHEILLVKKMEVQKTQIIEHKASAESLVDVYKRFKSQSKKYDFNKTSLILLKQQVSELENKLFSSQADLVEKEEQHSKNEYNSMINMIKEELNEGDKCPVCGSVFHNSDILYKDNNITIISDEIKLLKEELHLINSEYSKKKIDIGVLENDLIKIEDEINELKQRYGSLTKKLNGITLIIDDDDIEERINDFIKSLNGELFSLSKAYELVLTQKEATEKQQQEEIKQLNKIEKDISVHNERLKTLQLNLSGKKEEKSKGIVRYDTCEHQYLIYAKKYTEIKDFVKKRAELVLKEQEREQLRINSDLERVKYDELNKFKEKIVSELTELDKEITTSERVLEIEVRNYDNLVQEVYIICLDKRPTEYKDELEKLIQEIENDYWKLKTVLNVNEEKINFLNKELTSRSEEFKIIEELLNKQRNKVENLLRINEFESREFLIGYYAKEVELRGIEDEINLYKNAVNKTENNIARVSSLLNSELVTDEEWGDFCLVKEQNEEDYTRKIAEVSALEEKKQRMKKELDEVKLLAKEKEQNEHRLAMLNDIDSLISANKFVEFAAYNELYYISSEASERLMSITGRYALELDENGEFIIRDDLNGGVRREAATLSGGETFVTSLALALALSSQIQLKGNVPLELFFLDEGFGSLDSELINIVMESLEKLRDKRMSVGIISHVDELKSRVPIKLVTQPARFGEHGSTVRIEYT